MALPSGYSKIDYIEATGTQYINTGFKPNGNSRIVMDCEPTNLSSALCFFCARTEIDANDTTANVAFYLGRKYRKDFYGESKSTTAAYTAGTRFTIDSNKNEVAFGADYTLTFTASSKVSPMPLILMASAVPGDTDGTVKSLANYAKMKLYGAKIYDNGTLVRDFIPCKNASGTIGLWDNVNSVFYANAGTGTFSTGTKHKTMIDGTGYEIKSGRVLIAGTGYDIKKGRTLIDGTGYDIKFGVSVGELAVGTSVYMNVGGVRKEFIIVQQGNPDTTKYDASCDGTWVTQKQFVHIGIWSSQYNIYEDSTIHNYLNSTYLTSLDENIQRLIKQVKIPYLQNGTLADSILSIGENGLSTKVFALSKKEVGTTLGDDRYIPDDGTKLDYFIDGANGNARRTGFESIGIANSYALRSPWTGPGYTNVVWSIGMTGVVDHAGEAWSTNVKNSMEYPATFILPSDDAIIDDNFNIIPT